MFVVCMFTEFVVMVRLVWISCVLCCVFCGEC